jgi:membrane-associated protein
VDLLSGLLDALVHLDKHLLEAVQTYGGWVYLLLFLIVFCETGLVVTPFLPGDSLLFVAGTLAGAGSMNVHLLVVLLIAAAVLGDSVNYAIGRWLGPRVFRRDDSWFFKRAYIERTHAYFDKYGGRTIVIARFIPIIRTYYRFLMFNVGGAVLWVGLITYAGYLFGNVPIVKNNLTVVILGIIVLSISPGIVEYLRHRLRQRSA